MLSNSPWLELHRDASEEGIASLPGSCFPPAQTKQISAANYGNAWSPRIERVMRKAGDLEQRAAD